ncbi:MAG: cupin domain-containing protein [Tissierellia bacterium]|nr:cupin domain-containing protein [Tissierellia bacterium]
MLLKGSDMKVLVHDEFLGGKGTLTNTHFLNNEDACGAGRLFAKSMLTPGSSIGYHTHQGDFEVYYILTGKAKVNHNGTDYILEAGDSILCRNGESHSIENIGDTNLEYIAIILFDKENA